MNVKSYLDIAAQIRAKVPTCKSIDIFNNQLEEPQLHQPLNMPCVLIEWLPTEWSQMGAGTQDGVGGFRIHCVVNSMRSTYNLDQKTDTQKDLSTQHLKFQHEVHKALQDFEPHGYTQLMRTRTVPDHRYTSVLDITHEYTAGEIYVYENSDLTTTQVTDFPINPVVVH